MTLEDRARALAEAQAAIDRELLARFVHSGKVVRTDTGSNELVRDIEARLYGPRRAINLAIRPKRKKGRRR